MDSTYATLANIPLTTLLAITYGGFGVPVAFMISTNEDSTAYFTFLDELFAGATPPEAIMVDKIDAELKAIREFAIKHKSNTVSVVCYFHVLQAIQKYLKMASVMNSEASVIIGMIKAIHLEQDSTRCDSLWSKLFRYLQQQGKYKISIHHTTPHHMIHTVTHTYSFRFRLR